MVKSMYQRGYDDGYRGKEKLSASMLEFGVQDYMKGYEKGKADKEFSDAYSDEAFGIHDGFDG